MSNWYPKASRTQDFSKKYPGAPINPNVGVIHSTEGTGWPSYVGGSTAPTFTLRPNFKSKTVSVRQHFPANRSSRALVNLAGGVETNTANAIQFELVGTCDPATKRNWEKKGLKANRDFIYMPTAPDWFLQAFADLLVWCAKTYKDFKIKDAAPGRWKAYPGSYGVNNKNRLSFAQWRKAYGLVGHQHVPENSHGDPGAFPIKKVIDMAKAKSNPKPAVRKPPAGKTESFGRVAFLNTKGGDAAGKKTFNKRAPQMVQDVVKGKSLVVGFCEVQPGAQVERLTKLMNKRGYVRRGYYGGARLALFAKKGIKPVKCGKVYRTKFKNQNLGQKEGLLARTFENQNGIKITIGVIHLDYRKGYEEGRVRQANEAFAKAKAIAKTDKAHAVVVMGDTNDKTKTTFEAAYPHGFRDAFGDVGKKQGTRIDHTYLRNAKASTAFQRKTASDHKSQHTDVEVYV